MTRTPYLGRGGAAMRLHTKEERGVPGGRNCPESHFFQPWIINALQAVPPKLEWGEAILGEAGPRHQPESGHKFIQRHVVHLPRDSRGDAVRYERLQSLPLCQLLHHDRVEHQLAAVCVVTCYLRPV